jgi:hypothetical protein
MQMQFLDKQLPQSHQFMTQPPEQIKAYEKRHQSTSQQKRGATAAAATNESFPGQFNSYAI